MTPNTTVTLYATDFDISNRYVIAVTSVGEALGIVSAYPSQVYTNCYWQRTDDFVFRCNGNINEVEQYNYCVFLNNGRYNFAFITKCQYVNDAMTWVYLTIDPWLNFAGQYVFHASPMRRCHPPEGDSQKNFHTEPITVEKWNVRKKTFGDPGTAGTYKLFVMLKLHPDTYTNMGVGAMWQGVMDILNGNGIANFIAVVTAYRGASTLIVGLHPQAGTSLYGLADIETLIQKILQVGREGDIIGAYYVPDHVLNDTTSGFKSTIQPFATTINMSTVPPDSSYHWKKMGYSEQFNRFSVNVCGNITYLPYNDFKTQFSGMTLNIAADPGANGCIYAWFNDADLDNASSYMMHSQKWDTVQLTGYGVNDLSIASLGLQMGKTAFTSADRLIKSAMKLDITGALEAAGSGAVDLAQDAIQGLEILRSGGYAGSLGQSSMSAYNMNFPLVQMIHEHMFNDAILDNMFGTYGYMQDGDIKEIQFKTLPYWNYYETMEAAITGKQVPQKYLNQVIQMFNRGVFVFNDTASYKDFSKAQLNHY